MKKLLVVAALVAAILAPSAQSITYGTPTGNLYPYVGALVGTFSWGTGPYCSGTLVSPTVFLTAAHCEEGERVCVTFDPVYTSKSKLYCGTWYAHPTLDIAVIVFDKPIKGIEPAVVAPLGFLDEQKLTQKTAFTSVGYGAQEQSPPHGNQGFTYLDTREYAVGYFNSLTRDWIHISQNIHTGSGGTCYGDSGGPQFFEGTNIVVSVTVTGDMFCKATNVTQRLDTYEAQSWLSQFLPYLKA